MLLSNLWVSIPIKSKLHAAKGHHCCLTLIRPTPGRKWVASTLDSCCQMQFLLGLDRFNIFDVCMFIVTCPLSNGDELTFLFSDEIHELNRAWGIQLWSFGAGNDSLSELFCFYEYVLFVFLPWLSVSMGQRKRLHECGRVAYLVLENQLWVLPAYTCSIIFTCNAPRELLTGGYSSLRTTGRLGPLSISLNEKMSRLLFSQESERWQVNEVSLWKWKITRSHLEHKTHLNWQSVIAMTIYHYWHLSSDC